MSRKISFAVVEKATDIFITMQRAETKTELTKKYPESQFSLFDMTGNDDIPSKPGGVISDLTIDPVSGDWKWKLTDSEIVARTKTAKTSMIRAQLVKLKTDKIMADGLGTEYSNEATRLGTKITALESELAGL